MAASQAIELQSVYGLSSSHSAGALDLTDARRQRICYAAAHMVVIHTEGVGPQSILQGHCQPVSCLATSSDRSVIASADIGPESLLALWNAQTASPFWTVSRPHSNGVLAMDLSPKGRHLVTLSAVQSNTDEQQLVVWDISKPAQTPEFAATVPAGDPQTAVTFSADGDQLLSNGKHTACFWQLTPAGVVLCSAPMGDSKFKHSTADLTMSAFLPDGVQAASGTVSGDIILWTPPATQEGSRLGSRKVAKIISIHSSPITSLSCVDRFLVSGAADGYVRFFDSRLRLVAWFEDLDAGPVQTIAFSAVPATPPQRGTAGELEVFVAPDFVVSTSTGNIVAVKASSFDDASGEEPSHRLLVQGVVRNITATATHPTKPQFILAGDSGRLQLWDLLTQTLVNSHKLPSPASITCIKYSHDGMVVAMGTSTGVVRICKEAECELVADFRPVKQAITHLDFSSTGRLLAVGFEGGSVALVACLPWRGGQPRWELIGHQTPHTPHTPLAGLTFGEAPSGMTKLFSLNQDATIAEYNLDKLSTAHGFHVSSLHPLSGPGGQAGGPTPTALAFAPPLPYFAHGSADTLLLVADDAHKLRLYNADTHTCVATAVGPLHGGPVTSCRVFSYVAHYIDKRTDRGLTPNGHNMHPVLCTSVRQYFQRRSVSTEAFYVAYCTAEQVVGLMAWPLDGDPGKTLGLIAHPGPIVGMCLSHDSCKLVTAGAADGSIMVWQMDSDALESTLGGAAQQHTPLEVLTQIEGPTSSFQQDALDYFCYTQLASQSGKAQNLDKLRLLEGRISVDSIAGLCQALGYFPSGQDLTAMMQELAYKAAAQHKPAPTGVDLQQFLSLYLNYRPALEEAADEVSQAFATLGADPATGKLSRDELVRALTSYGEAMSHEELVCCMEALTGTQEVLDVLPSGVTAEDFACGLLGFENGLDSEPLEVAATA